MSLPYLPLFPDAYFGDTKHLTCEEHGAYLQLLMIAWKSGGIIPDDDAKLARMVGLSPKRWASIKPTIMQFWVMHQNGGWTQKRLSEELSLVEGRIEKRRAAGKLGGRPKSLKIHDDGKANGSPEGKQNESKMKAPIPIPIKKEEDTNVSSTRARKTDFDVWYQNYPHKVGRSAAEKSYDRARKNGASQQELVLGLEHYVKTKPPDREWCNPATWLNQERWKDQPALKGSPPDLSPALEHGSEVAGQVFLRQDTPQWDAWTKYRGRPPPTDRRGGWLLPSEWPPEMGLNGCNQSEKPEERLRH